MNWRVETYSEVERFAGLLDYSNELLAEYRKEADERYDELSELYANCELDEAEEVSKGLLNLKRITIGEIRKVMDAYFFEPQEEEDLNQIDHYLQVWVDLAYHEWKIGFTSKAIEICLVLLDEIGRRFEEDGYYRYYDDLCPIDYTCENIAYVLTEIMRSPGTKQGMKNRILNGLKEINRHDSFSDYCYFDLEQFIENKGEYEFPELWIPSITDAAGNTIIIE